MLILTRVGFITWSLWPNMVPTAGKIMRAHPRVWKLLGFCSSMSAPLRNSTSAIPHSLVMVTLVCVYSRVCKEMPYGPDHIVEKEECVGHVMKRMGTRLRKLVERLKGQKLEDGKGLQGRGRLFYHDVGEIFWPQPIRSLKLGHVTGQGSMSPTWVGRVSDPGKSGFHKMCKNLDNIAVYLIASLKSKWKNKQIKNMNSWIR